MKFDKVSEPEGGDSRPIGRRILIGVALALALSAGGAWLFVGRQRQAVAERTAARAGAQRIRTELADARAAAATGAPTEEEKLRRLEELRRAQRAEAALNGERSPTLAREMQRTELQIDVLQNRDRLQRSLECERAAAPLSAAGDFAGAEPLWREALALQHEVNRASGEAARNVDREWRLQQELMRAAAEPRQGRVAQLLQRAAAAGAAGAWTEALADYREARDLQEGLNREYPRTRYSDLAAIARIDTEIASLNDDGLSLRVAAQWEEARRLAADRAPSADGAFAAAAATQRLLNERFPRSRFVSMERLAEIEADRHSAAAVPLLARARQSAEAAHGLFRRRQVFQAQLRVTEGFELLENLRARLPRARDHAEELRLQLAFLAAHAGELAAIQDRIYEQLAPLPGRSEAALLRTELAQEDFARVMSANPSRTGGPTLPVESVSQVEADEFCRRLSWVMGATVRLPTAEEMKAAHGAPDGFAAIDEGLAEWLRGRVADDPGAAPVWRSAAVGTENAARNSRDRSRGFRVVVEIDLTAAAN